MLLRSGRRVATGEEASRAAVSRRRCRARPDRLAGIPEEILQEILVRLPAKSVLRCRAVCRSWRSLASDPAFLLDHHHHQPELHLINSYRTVKGVDFWYPALDAAVHLQSGELRPVFKFPDLFYYPLTVDASCDGLFVAGNYICNPATRQWAPLSPNKKLIYDINLVGLYWHQPSGEYRVIYWTQSSAPFTMPIHPPYVLCPNEYRVLTVGTNESRIVDCPLTKMIGALGPIICGAPVLLNGSLHVHWKMRSSVRYHKILVFDTVAETFRHMIPPPVNPRHGMHLLDMGGTLAAAISKDAMAMSIYVLQDQSQQDVWTFQYRIKLPVMDIRRFHEQGDWSVKVVSEEGDVLVCCYGQLLHCDKGGNLVANFKFDDEIPVVIPHRLKESLIQHTFFQKKTEN